MNLDHMKLTHCDPTNFKCLKVLILHFLNPTDLISSNEMQLEVEILFTFPSNPKSNLNSSKLPAEFRLVNIVITQFYLYN